MIDVPESEPNDLSWHGDREEFLDKGTGQTGVLSPTRIGGSTAEGQPVPAKINDPITLVGKSTHSDHATRSRAMLQILLVRGVLGRRFRSDVMDLGETFRRFQGIAEKAQVNGCSPGDADIQHSLADRCLREVTLMGQSVLGVVGRSMEVSCLDNIDTVDHRSISDNDPARSGRSIPHSPDDPPCHGGHGQPPGESPSINSPAAAAAAAAPQASSSDPRSAVRPHRCATS